MTNPGKKHISEEQLLANPHDGGLAPSKFPIKVQKAGIVVFVLAVVAASAFALTEHWRRATFTLGASLLYLSLLRLTCDSKILGVLAVQENGDVVEEREANPETRPIVDINGQQTRPNRASSNPDETNAVTENLQAIPQEAAAPPYQTNTVPYAATTGQAGGAGQ